MKYLQSTIDSLNAQDTPPDAIELNLSREYSRRDLGTVNEAEIPTGCDVYWGDEDYGPATKILPTVTRYHGTDARLVYCDDDRIYEPGWLTRLVNFSDKYPGAVIADRMIASRRKENILRWQNRGPLYRLYRALSFGQWSPLRTKYKFDVAEGCGGVLIRPDYLPNEAFSIPDILWTVDDVWLSGMYHSMGLDIKRTDIVGVLQNDKWEDGKCITDLEPLYLYETEGHGRLKANVACIKYMRKHYGVFKGPRHA